VPQAITEEKYLVNWNQSIVKNLLKLTLRRKSRIKLVNELKFVHFVSRLFHTFTTSRQAKTVLTKEVKIFKIFLTSLVRTFKWLWCTWMTTSRNINVKVKKSPISNLMFLTFFCTFPTF